MMDITVAEADAYHALRGNDDWQYFGDEAEKLAALFRSSDYIRREYRFIDTDDTEALKREAVIQLAPQIDTLSEKRDAQRVKTKKESLEGVASEETTYFDAVAGSDPFPDITALLSGVTVRPSTGKGISVIRLVR